MAVFDFSFMGGSMGTAVGEGIVAASELAISYNQFCCWRILKTSYKVRMNFFVSDSACKEACWRIKLFRNGLDLFSLSKFLCPVKGECTFSITKLYKQICIISLLLQPFFLIKQRLYSIHSLTLPQHCWQPNVVDIYHFQNILTSTLQFS